LKLPIYLVINYKYSAHTKALKLIKSAKYVGRSYEVNRANIRQQNIEIKLKIFNKKLNIKM